MTLPTSSPPPPPSPGPSSPVPAPSEPYPVLFDVDYPARLGRFSTAFRLLFILPAWVYGWILANLLNSALLAGWIAVFFRRKYPAWLFSATSGVAGYNARVWSYGALLTDRFPSFEPSGSPVHLEFDEPPNDHLSRWRVLLWKLVLLVPHAVVLSFLMIAVFVVVFIAWFAILFTGTYPRGMFAFVTGIQRWYWRVFAYLASFNDRYPPFGLAAEAGPASNASTITGGVIGLLATGGMVTLIVVGAIIAPGVHSEEIDYAGLQRGVADTEIYVVENAPRGEILFQLSRVHDPGDELVGVLDLDPHDRVVVFEWYIGTIDRSAEVESARVRLDYEDGDGRDTVTALFVTAGDTIAPLRITSDQVTTIRAVFVIPQRAQPTELRWRPGFGPGFKYIFE